MGTALLLSEIFLVKDWSWNWFLTEGYFPCVFFFTCECFDQSQIWSDLIDIETVLTYFSLCSVISLLILLLRF